MAAAVPEIGPLLDLLLADLGRTRSEDGFCPLAWGVVAGRSQHHLPLVQHLNQEYGGPSLVQPSTAEPPRTPSACPPQLLVLAWRRRAPRGNGWPPAEQAPAVLVQYLPPRGGEIAGLGRWRRLRHWSSQGYTCLAIGPEAALLCHRRYSRKPTGQQEPGALRIHSFDFWDTLITRWDGDPKRVFDFVGTLAGLADFRQQRVMAERMARQRQRDYRLEHIYAELATCSGLSPRRCQELMELELEAERQFAQPVQANIQRLAAGDVVISDMYLSAEQMRTMARPYVNLDRHPFLVSASGKQQGHLWRRLKQAGIAARHLGDNYVADYVKAAQRNHQVALVRHTGFSGLEQRFADAGLLGLANLVRLQRLAEPGPEQAPFANNSSATGLLQVQRRLNLPLLYLVALELLHRGRRSDGPSQMLFCARDCAYLHGLYRAMVAAQERFSHLWADGEGNTGLPPHGYFFTSRQAKGRASKDYRAYCRSLLRDAQGDGQPLLIDVQGSGRSSHVFFERVLEVPVRQLFVYASGERAAAYGAESLLSRDVLRALLPKASDLLEVLSYSSDHSLVDMHAVTDVGFVPEFEPEQRPAHLLGICRDFEQFFAGVQRRMAQAPFQFLFAQHDLVNYQPSHLQLLNHLDGVEDLRLLRQLFLRFHRRH